MVMRDARLCSRGLLQLIVLTLIMAGVCLLAGRAMERGSGEVYRTAQVALVDEDRSLVSSVAIAMVSSQDFASPLNIQKTSSQQAMDGLLDGTYSAVILLPDDYAENIMTGKDASARIVLSEGAALHGNIIGQLADFGETLTSAGQFGIFAGEEIAVEEYPQDYDEYITQVNLLYVNEALSASGRYFVEEVTDYADTEMTVSRWYILVYAMLFSQLCALLFLPLSADMNTDMIRRLRAASVTRSGFLAGKILFPLLYQLLAATGALLVLHCSGKVSLTLLGCVGVLGALCVSVVFGAALTLCLPESTAAAAVTAAAALGLFCVGGLIPRANLASWVIAFGSRTPLGASISLASSLFGGTPDWKALLTAVIWIGASFMCLRGRLIALERGRAQ